MANGETPIDFNVFGPREPCSLDLPNPFMVGRVWLLGPFLTLDFNALYIEETWGGSIKRVTDIQAIMSRVSIVTRGLWSGVEENGVLHVLFPSHPKAVVHTHVLISPGNMMHFMKQILIAQNDNKMRLDHHRNPLTQHTSSMVKTLAGVDVRQDSELMMLPDNITDWLQQALKSPRCYIDKNAVGLVLDWLRKHEDNRYLLKQAEKQIISFAAVMSNNTTDIALLSPIKNYFKERPKRQHEQQIDWLILSGIFALCFIAHCFIESKRANRLLHTLAFLLVTIGAHSIPNKPLSISTSTIASFVVGGIGAGVGCIARCFYCAQSRKAANTGVPPEPKIE